MHGADEKLLEVRNNAPTNALLNRTDWLSSFANAVPFTLREAGSTSRSRAVSTSSARSCTPARRVRWFPDLWPTGGAHVRERTWRQDRHLFAFVRTSGGAVTADRGRAASDGWCRTSRRL